jgi:cytochrome P450
MGWDAARRSRAATAEEPRCMLSSGQGAALYPPRIRPAARPLRFPFNLAKLLDNNLEIVPEQAYHEPLVVAPGPPRMAFFTGPELVRTLLHTDAGSFPKGKLQVDTLKPIFGAAMISAEGREWRWQRGVAAPLFRHEELLQYGPVMSSAAAATVAKWRASPPGTVHAIHLDMMRTAFRVISNAMLTGGAEAMLGAIETGHADYYRGINWWIAYTLFGLPPWLPRPRGKLMRAHERRLRTFVASLVRARRADAAAGEDLLARMLRASDPETGRFMSDEHVADNVIAFLMAGYDTTALSLAWTLYLVSQSPEWEERILQEVKRVVGPGPVTSAHVAQLGVVQQVYNESLRLFPTAPIIVRDIPADTMFDGTSVPAGTVGIIPIYAIHRHRRLWNDPDRFDPDRFSPSRESKPGRFQFMPFGAGPRVCIGAAFATIEATIMLATFVRAARFETAPGFDPRPSGQMFLLPKNGMPMRVTIRERAL